MKTIVALAAVMAAVLFSPPCSAEIIILRAPTTAPPSPELEAVQRAAREALERARQRERQERYDAATKQYEDAVRNYEQTIKDQKARAERARQDRCDRLSQRASTEWLDTNRASSRYQAECD